MTEQIICGRPLLWEGSELPWPCPEVELRCQKCNKSFCPSCEETPEDIDLCAKCRAKEART